MTSPAQEIARWLDGDMAKVRPFCAEVQRLLNWPEPPCLQIAECVRQHPDLARSQLSVAAVLRGKHLPLPTTETRAAAPTPAAPRLQERHDQRIGTAADPKDRPQRRPDRGPHAPDATADRHDPRDQNTSLPRCPHGILSVKKCHICNPDKFDGD
jgi:hypothetical protein